MGAGASTFSDQDLRVKFGQAVIDELRWGPRDIRKAAGEIATLMQSAGVSEAEAIAQVVEDYRTLPPIRLIDFDVFKNHGSIPRLGFGKSERFPDAPCVDLTVPLKSIDASQCFIVFVSQCWMAGWSGRDDKTGSVIDQKTADEWRGYPHPDNKSNDKFRLEVDGIEKLIKTMAPGTKTYLWHDFSCMDQNGNPAGELKQLDKIVEMSDCIFTPIVDLDHARDWQYPDGWSNYFTEYEAKLFSVGKYAYVNRAWCRVEMLYAANIPLNDQARATLFRAGLQIAVTRNLRPHYLYGDKEISRGYGPIQLPPLAYSHLQTLSPLACIENLTSAEDRGKIESLMDELKPYLKQATAGYEGERNENGKMHGRGKYTYASGDVYEGEFKDDKRNGRGKYTYASGDVYEGEYKDGNYNGRGKYTYASGDVRHDGEWVDDQPV